LIYRPLVWYTRKVKMKAVYVSPDFGSTRD